MNAPDYEKLRERIFAAIWHDLDPLEAEIENSGQLPLGLITPVLKRTGAFGLMVPEEYGGAGLSVTQYLPILAEFAKIQGGIRLLVHCHNSFAYALSRIGSKEQRARVLPAAALGERSIAFALTEPDHGTGADLGATAVTTNAGYRLNGKKHLVTNSHIATEFICFAKTAPSQVSAFLVPRDSPGLAVEPLSDLMGCKGGEHGELTLTDVNVPRDALIGAEDQGIRTLEAALEISRVFVAAASLGTSQRALELSLQHARTRVTFGKPLAARQAIQRYLAEMAIDIQALGLMLGDAARKADRGLRIPAESSMVKQFGLEAVSRVTDRALLIHGGIGYTRKTPIERLYRDARLNWLEEGTPTVQYLVTAEQLVNGYQFSDPFSGT
jgi:alkylation response protein AidB-like acyl-CoA dehydrogenase